METSKCSGGEGDESFRYNSEDQLPSLLMAMLNLSGFMLLLEVIVKGCHCSLEMLGTFTKRVLVGV